MRGYVLAGGASRRFGADKASVQLGGKSMLRRMCQLVESGAGSAAIGGPGARPGRDGGTSGGEHRARRGPLRGSIPAPARAAPRWPKTAVELWVDVATRL